jgi:hypothetical protein
MFPLSSPIVPHAGIPLHVFEDRYRRLMVDVVADDRRFGIVMIDRGSEVGGGDDRSDVGVMVEVVDEEELDDGRWVLIGAGLGRIRVAEWLEDDPYPVAMVEEIAELPVALDSAIRDDIQGHGCWARGAVRHTTVVGDRRPRGPCRGNCSGTHRRRGVDPVPSAGLTLSPAGLSTL